MQLSDFGPSYSGLYVRLCMYTCLGQSAQLQVCTFMKSTHTWKVSPPDYHTLASLAHQVFSVLATSAPVEQMFSQEGKI